MLDRYNANIGSVVRLLTQLVPAIKDSQLRTGSLCWAAGSASLLSFRSESVD